MSETGTKTVEQEIDMAIWNLNLFKQRPTHSYDYLIGMAEANLNAAKDKLAQERAADEILGLTK